MSFACSRSIAWLARLLVCVPMAMQAQSRSAPPLRGAETLDSLTARYVAALRARDTAAQNALTHSASLRCPSAHDTLFQNPTRRFQDSVRAGKIDGPFRLIVHDMSDSMPRVGGPVYLPVVAPKQIQIDFIGPSGSSFGLAHRVAQENGRWVLVDMCLTAEGLRTFMPVRKPATLFLRRAVAGVVAVSAISRMHAETSASVAFTSPMPALPSDAGLPQSVCFRDQPGDRCRSYTIFDVQGVMTLGFWRRELGGCSQPTDACGSSGLENGYWAWDLGAMRRLGTGLAVGGQVRIGAGSSSDFRVALEPRGRLWVTRWLTLDAAAGPLWVRQSYGAVTNSGVTGEVVLGAADLVGVSLGGDAIGSPRRSAAYVGLRTGSYASFAGSAVAAVALVVQRGLRNF